MATWPFSIPDCLGLDTGQSTLVQGFLRLCPYNPRHYKMWPLLLLHVNVYVGIAWLTALAKQSQFVEKLGGYKKAPRGIEFRDRRWGLLERDVNTIRYRLGHSNPPKDLVEYFLSPRLCVGHYHAVTVHGRTQGHQRLPFG